MKTKDSDWLISLCIMRYEKVCAHRFTIYVFVCATGFTRHPVLAHLSCALPRGWLAGSRQRASHVGTRNGARDLRQLERLSRAGRFVVGFLKPPRDPAPPTTMSNEFTIDEFPALRSRHVYIRDEVAVLDTINAIRQGGANNLQIVTDFDLTVTKQHIDGRHVLSSFGMFRKCKQLPQQYLDEAKHLYNKYRPMEIDPDMPLNKKADAMRDWMIAAQNLLKGIEFDPHELEEIAQGFDNILRDGTEEFFEKLYNARVPIIVFSAGLGDIVEVVLRYHNALFDNVKVISNFLKYNGNQLDGFKNDVLIHVYNKNECALAKDYLKVLQKRQNVLLMGDTIGDASMVEGIEDTKAVLKIGFLYEHVEASLDSFMEHFDIVLVDDQTMQVPMQILQNIF